MSFLDDIVDVGSSVWDWATGSSTSAGIARATALGYMLKEVQASINKDNDATKTAKDFGVREQVDPDTDHNIPVVYGQAFLGGIVTDAVLSDDNMTMWYCITICEKTGVLMSSGADSVISFESVYWNEGKLAFKADGITVASISDADGNTSTEMDGLVKFYFFSGGSNKPVKLAGYGSGNTANANTIFPNWTTSHTMDDLVFALVRVDYNKTKNVTGLGNIEFQMRNTMKMPGDCLYDYMTNTRYGAGITPEEIYQA